MTEAHRPFVFGPIPAGPPQIASRVGGTGLFSLTCGTLAHTPCARVIPRIEDRLNEAMDAILHATPGNPVPDNHTVGFFRSHDGINLRYAIFRSSDAVSKGTVVLLHGRNESIEKYYETIRDLNAKGLWVATYDLRGQGGSARMLADIRRGHVRRFADYEQDLSTFLEHVVLPDTRLPFFLLAHSTGALIALSAAPMLANRIERMVMTAPFVGLVNQALPHRIIHPLSTVLCLSGFGNRQFSRDPVHNVFEGNPLTSDEVRFRRNADIITRHPELALGAPTARWLREAMTAIKRVSHPEHLASIMIPTLLIAPTQDRIIPYSAQEGLSRHFRAGQLIPVPGARHEVLQERDTYRDQAMAAINAFFPGSDAEDNDLQMLDFQAAV